MSEQSWEQRVVDEIIAEELVTRERELVDKLTYLEEAIAETDSYSAAEMYERWLDYDQELSDIRKVLGNVLS